MPHPYEYVRLAQFKYPPIGGERMENEITSSARSSVDAAACDLNDLHG